MHVFYLHNKMLFFFYSTIKLIWTFQIKDINGTTINDPIVHLCKHLEYLFIYFLLYACVLLTLAEARYPACNLIQPLLFSTNLTKQI